MEVRQLTRRAALAGSACVLGACAGGRELARAEDWRGWVALGGLEQWVTVSGDDGRAPVVLFVHGGPGFAMSAFEEEFGAYALDFTVVQWDQRGAGRTYGRHGVDGASLTIDRIARDGVELLGELRRRFGGRPVFVVGHSLGSIVAVRMVQEAPELVSGYVGAAQFVSFQETLERQHAYLRALGAEGVDETGVPDPASIEDFYAVNRVLNRHVPADDAAWFARMGARLPEVMSAEALRRWGEGREASADLLMPQIVGLDLSVSAPSLACPCALVHGGDDIFSPCRLAEDYFRGLDAPLKSVTIIEGAGHFPFLTHPAAFLRALKSFVELV